MCECFTFFLLHTDCSKSHTTNLGGGIFAVPWLSSISIALNTSFAKICLLVVPNTWNFDTLRLLASPEFWALVTEYFKCFPEGSKESTRIVFSTNIPRQARTEWKGAFTAANLVASSQTAIPRVSLWPPEGPPVHPLALNWMRPGLGMWCLDPIFQFHPTHFARAVVGLFVGLTRPTDANKFR